jgi:hypothetical protein
MLLQLKWMYAYRELTPPVRRNRSASAATMVCSDFIDNLIGGTLEPLASLSRLSFLCGSPSISFAARWSIGLTLTAKDRERACVQRSPPEPDSRRTCAAFKPLDARNNVQSAVIACCCINLACL